MFAGDWAFLATTSFSMSAALSRIVWATGVQLASSAAVIFSDSCRLAMRCSIVSALAWILASAVFVAAVCAKALLVRAVPPSRVALSRAGIVRARANVIAAGRVKMVMDFTFLDETRAPALRVARREHFTTGPTNSPVGKLEVVDWRSKPLLAAQRFSADARA